MKKYILSLLFLFPVITYPAAAQSVYQIGAKYLEKKRFLTHNEATSLFDIDCNELVPKSYKNKTFSPHSAFATVKQKSQLMLLPVIDTTTNQWSGYAIFTKKESDTLFLDYLIVGEEHQKKGIGTMIIDWLFKELKPKAIKLKATETSAVYYEKLGFINGPEYDDYSKTNPYL